MLCVLGMAVFLALFLVQLISPAGGHLRTTYIATATTPCSGSTLGCVGVPGYNSGGHTYDDVPWKTDFYSWENLTLQDHSLCPCLELSSGYRKYVMNDFPCADFVPLCNNSVQFRGKWDFFAANATCFPTPHNSAGGLDKLQVPGFHSLTWNFTLNDTVVQAAGTAFCEHTKRMTMFQVHQVYAMLVPAWQWHLAVVESLKNELSRPIDLALSPVLAAEASPAEVTYAKAYLEWLSYRIYGYALNETSGLGGPRSRALY